MCHNCNCHTPDLTGDEIPKLYNTREAAPFLKLAPVTVKDLCRNGKLSCRKVRGRYYLTAADIRKALEGQ